MHFIHIYRFIPSPLNKDCFICLRLRILPLQMPHFSTSRNLYDSISKYQSPDSLLQTDTSMYILYAHSVLHINIFLPEYFLVQGSRSCNTEQNGTPSHKMVTETFQKGLRPSMSGQGAREVVSKWEPMLPEALPAHRSAHTPGTPSYAHGTLGSARHRCCRAGSVLPAGHPPPSPSLTTGTLLPQEPPCHGHGPQSHRALRNPGTALLSEPLLHTGSSPTPSTAPSFLHLKFLLFTPQQLMHHVRGARGSGQGHLTLLNMLQLQAQHQSLPPPPHQGEPLLLTYLHQALPHLQCCHQGPPERLLCSALPTSRLSPSPLPFLGKSPCPTTHQVQKEHKSQPSAQFRCHHTHFSLSLPAPNFTTLHLQGHTTRHCSESFSAPFLLQFPFVHTQLFANPTSLWALTFAHSYTHDPAPTQAALPIHLFTHTQSLNPATSALAAPAGCTD